MKNARGLDADYHYRILERTLRDLSSFSPDDFARVLVRMAHVADAEAATLDLDRLNGKPTGTTSDKYRAELYDEVWQLSRDMGCSNVGEALGELANLRRLVEQQRAELAAANGQVPAAVHITSHIDEIDAPVWQFINEEARKLGPVTGSIDTYGLSRTSGQQTNGQIAVLWSGRKLHALAVAVRDGMNHTACIRLLVQEASGAGALVEALKYFVDREAPIQSKFDLYGPQDIANGMRLKFKQAKEALAAHKAEAEKPEREPAGIDSEGGTHD